MAWDPGRERDLVERAKADPEAFATLYDLHFRRIYSYAYHRTGSHQEAEDVTSQTFLQAFEHLGGYRHRGVPFYGWLYRIATSIAADRHRRRVPTAGLEEAEQTRSREPLPEEIVLRSERARELRDAVAALPESQRQAVVLKFSQELRNREIGEVMGRSEGAVKLLLHRALCNLRRIDGFAGTETRHDRPDHHATGMAFG